MTIHRDTGCSFDVYRASWTEDDRTVVMGPSRSTLDEADRDDPGHPIRKDAGGPITRARRSLPNEPTFRPEPIVSHTARKWWG